MRAWPRVESKGNLNIFLACQLCLIYGMPFEQVGGEGANRAVLRWQVSCAPHTLLGVRFGGPPNARSDPTPNTRMPSQTPKPKPKPKASPVLADP